MHWKTRKQTNELCYVSVVSFKPLQEGWEKRPKGDKNSSDNPRYGESQRNMGSVPISLDVKKGIDIGGLCKQSHIESNKQWKQEPSDVQEELIPFRDLQQQVGAEPEKEAHV